MSDDLTTHELARLRRVRKNTQPIAALNCEVFDLVLDEFWPEQAGGEGLYLHFRGIDGRAYRGCMLAGDVKRLRDLLNERPW